MKAKPFGILHRPHNRTQKQCAARPQAVAQGAAPNGNKASLMLSVTGGRVCCNLGGAGEPCLDAGLQGLPDGGCAALYLYPDTGFYLFKGNVVIQPMLSVGFKV